MSPSLLQDNTKTKCFDTQNIGIMRCQNERCWDDALETGVLCLHSTLPLGGCKVWKRLHGSDYGSGISVGASVLITPKGS